MLRLLGQMMKLPIAAFVYGMEVLVKVMRDFQKTADHSVDTTVSAMVRDIAEGRDGQGHQAIDARVDTATRVYSEAANGGTRANDARATLEEDRQMAESKHDLNDDDLKLVRYKILFVKRDYEVAFPEHEELVPDNLSVSAYTGWKIAEFVQSLDEVDAPLKWRKAGKGYPPDLGPDLKIRRLPEDDKKYLRVYFEVLDRYTREKFKYEEEQVDVLRQIRDRLPDGRATGGPATTTSPSGGAPTTTGAGGAGKAGGGRGTP